MATGQIRWLCEGHLKDQRVTIINDSSQGPRFHLPNMEKDEAILGALLALEKQGEVEKRPPRKLRPWKNENSG